MEEIGDNTVDAGSWEGEFDVPEMEDPEPETNDTEIEPTLMT